MADTEAVIAALDKAAAAVAEARQLVSAVAEPGGGPEPPAEPPPAPLQPQDVTATGVPGGITLAWSNPEPAAALPVFLAWGAGTFLGKLTLAPGSTTVTVSELRPGLSHDFDIGYIHHPAGVDAAALVRVQGTPQAIVADPTNPSEPPAPSSPDLVYPSSAPWPDRRLFIVAHAGVGTGPLRRVASGADLQTHQLPGQWQGGDGGQWNLTSGGPFEGLDVRGMIYYTGSGPLTMTRCRVMGIRYAASSGKSGGTFRNCTIIPKPGMPLGQGGINFYGQTGWLIEGCDISGFADGVQCVGPGTIRDTWVHDLAYGNVPSGGVTHNDGIQCYGGRVTVERCVFDMGGRAGSTNGALFCSKPEASFVATELFAEVTHPDTNVLHAWSSPQGIVVNGGRVSKVGRLIGKVVLNGVIRD